MADLAPPQPIATQVGTEYPSQQDSLNLLLRLSPATRLVLVSSLSWSLRLSFGPCKWWTRASDADSIPASQANSCAVLHLVLGVLQWIQCSVGRLAQGC